MIGKRSVRLFRLNFNIVIANELITEFLKIEIQRSSIENPDRKIHFVSTKEIVNEGDASVKRLPEELKPLAREKNLILFFSFINLIGFILVVYQFYLSGLRSLTFVILSLLFLALLLIPLFILARLKKTLEITKISSNGIYTSEQTFRWDQLHDTFILKIPDGRNFKRYLVLVTIENKILKYSLGFFLVSDFWLANAIEKFK